MLTEFFVKEFIGGEQGMGSPFVDGFFIDVSEWLSLTMLVPGILFNNSVINALQCLLCRECLTHCNELREREP
jgi:hypothetical protein